MTAITPLTTGSHEMTPLTSKSERCYNHLLVINFQAFNDRVDTVVDWLKEDDVNLGLLYIEEPDHTGHMFGPDSQEVDAMLEKLNNVIGHLIKQLKDAELYDSMNIIITADHGMAELSEDRLVLLEEIDDLEELTDAKRTFITTTSAMIQPKNDTVKKIVYDVRDIIERNITS